jgi:plastocyanin
MEGMARTSYAFAFAAASLVSITACAPDAPDATGGAKPDDAAVAITTTIATVAPNGESITLQVLDNSFRPVDIEIEAGTEVVFDNRGRNEHNILPDAVKNDAGLSALLASDSSPSAWGVASTEFAPGEVFSHVFTAPGVYAYYCSIHGVPGAGMYGVIRVS